MIQTNSIRPGVEGTELGLLAQPSKPKAHKFILTLTRLCSVDCAMCCVDAIHFKNEAECDATWQEEWQWGRQLSAAQWMTIVHKIVAFDPHAEFDLSGGDCLALPVIRQRLIPAIVRSVRHPKQVAVTSTAASIQRYLDELAADATAPRPGAIHITYDGVREYSFENMRLVSAIGAQGMAVHVECPLTRDNCNHAVIQDIYDECVKNKIEEILLMRFMPVGRGEDTHSVEPTPEAYTMAISTFRQLAQAKPQGPQIKVQCALKEFDASILSGPRCKMGKETLCVMPNGTLLACGWAYGKEGQPLDPQFCAGHLLDDSIEDCLARLADIRTPWMQKYQGACIVCNHVNHTRQQQAALMAR